MNFTIYQGKQCFESITELILFAFKKEQTSLLSLEKICQNIQSDQYLIKRNNTLIGCETLQRRRISSALSSSDMFIRAGTQRACMWALRPNNPLFISDGQIASSLDHMLTNNGPLTLEEMVRLSDINGCNALVYEKYLNEHTDEIAKTSDGKYWFTNNPIPAVNYFNNICQALKYAFYNAFPNGACVEELFRYLSISYVIPHKKITRRNVSRELSRRPDFFKHLSRARYILVNQMKSPQTKGGETYGNINAPQIENDFDQKAQHQQNLINYSHENFMSISKENSAYEKMGENVTFINSFESSQANDGGMEEEYFEPFKEDEDFDPNSFFNDDFEFAF